MEQVRRDRSAEARSASRLFVQRPFDSWNAWSSLCAVLFDTRQLHARRSRVRLSCSMVCCRPLALTANLLPARELLFVAWRCRWSILARSSMTSTARQRPMSFHRFTILPPTKRAAAAPSAHTPADALVEVRTTDDPLCEMPSSAPYRSRCGTADGGTSATTPSLVLRQGPLASGHPHLPSRRLQLVRRSQRTLIQARRQ